MSKVMAWVYDNYYCWSIYDNCRGVYKDKEEALEMLKGGRYENQNLELMDLDTLGYTRYWWRPNYIVRTENIENTDPEYRKDKPSGNKREYLKYKWGSENSPESKEFRVDWYCGYGNRREAYHQALYDAGSWEEGEKDE